MGFFKAIFALFGKTIPYSKVFQVLFRKYSPLYRWRCCVEMS